ncbi:MAG: MBL fold metallo-hydrolase, partial [Actinomycetia bacterium]|nr:MBL fold metallo-hydrolase [Actinomycetes bacterium]
VDLLEQVEVPVHLQRPEVEFVTKTTGLGPDVLSGHDSGDIVTVGEISIELIHTPGHTPGSQCFLVRDHLVAGDTLFLDGCGRTDLPGGDPEELYRSLTDRLARVPDEATLFPGHLYSPKPSQSMGETRDLNVVFRPKSIEQWMMMFGH